jgi:hypothetical protein
MLQCLCLCTMSEKTRRKFIFSKSHKVFYRFTYDLPYYSVELFFELQTCGYYGNNPFFERQAAEHTIINKAT